MRWLLVAILINGLAPGLAEAGEAVAHYVSTGHLAHAAGEDDRGDRGPEHSCGVVFHQCACCTSMTAVPHAAAELGSPLPQVDVAAPDERIRTATRSLDPPYRPPIR